MFEQEKIARDELDTALREAGALGMELAHLAILETDGRISVHLRHGRGGDPGCRRPRVPKDPPEST